MVFKYDYTPMSGGFFSELFCLVEAFKKYDPATKSRLEILFLYPGIKAWILYKVAHFLYRRDIPFLPRLFSELGRFFTGIDIHPGAQLGRGVLMDHGLGIVIGETAIIGNDVLIYQGVTLGGTSLERKKRHPTIGDRCVIGAGAKILGNIKIGTGSRIGANSVVIGDVPEGSTAVGIPARIVSLSGGVRMGEELDHDRIADPVIQKITELEKRILALEKK
jgi:serine O-acetyltransferase